MGRGSQEAKNGERLGVQKGRSTPASRPSAAQPQWKPRQQPGSGNQRARACARCLAWAPRAQLCAGWCSRSRLPAPTPVAPRFTHPTLRLQSPLPSVPRTLDIPCPLNPVSGHPTFGAPRARKTPHPVFPRLGHPTFDPPRLGDPICSAPSTSGTLTSDTTLLTVPSVLALHVFAHCHWH